MIEFDFIDWDDSDDPEGNVWHIAAGGVTPEEVEEVLNDPDADEDRSRSSGRPAAFGWTSTGKYIIVVYEIAEEDGYRVLYPITSYEVQPPD